MPSVITRIFLPTLLLAVWACSFVRAADVPTPSGVVVQSSGECDVWLISSRCLPCPRNLCSPPGPVKYSRRIGKRWWRSTSSEFLSTLEPDKVTCFYVHGNRLSPSDARSQGMAMYRRLMCQSTSIRFVIWSWPSDKIHGIVRDARQKAIRSDGEAFYLANTLADFPDDVRLSLIGYSFGGRIVTGSLHLLAGGQFCGNALARDNPPDIRPRVALIAPAMTNAWLCPHGAHGLAAGQADRIYSTFNPLDSALKRFHVTTQKTKPRALGYCGVSQPCLGPHGHLVTQHNISPYVGKSHAFDAHTYSRPVMNQVRRYALWHEIQ